MHIFSEIPLQIEQTVNPQNPVLIYYHKITVRTSITWSNSDSYGTLCRFLYWLWGKKGLFCSLLLLQAGGHLSWGYYQPPSWNQKWLFFTLASHARLARFARVRLLRHALPISLLTLRKKNGLFCSLLLLQAGGHLSWGYYQPPSWNQRWLLKGLSHAICFLFKKTETFFPSVEFQYNVDILNSAMLIVLREINSARHQHDTERTQNRAGL